MPAERDAGASEAFTRRELEILQLLNEGLSDKDIAARLFLSVGTVKWHVQNIYSKLGVKRRTQAVKQARDRGLIGSSTPVLQPRDERLPLETTSFVDRHVETQQILQILDNPACRLLTLIGSGGIGKTRLALHVARNMADDLPDGKAFISLVGVSSHQHLAATLANALSFSFYGPEEPETQVVRYLSRKKALLLFDNYEQLLPDIALLAQILKRASGVKLMITSRERLNMREEWIFQVEGLPITTGQPMAAADACDLFVQRASQINVAFGGIGQDMPFVQQICRQVEGIPLAIELAAGWARSLTAKEIAQEMDKSYQLLRTALQNVPERHRSMSVVFEQTWERLLAQEQVVMEGLSVFRGGFTREAAEQVAGADLSLLAALQDKSLIVLGSSGRYGMHELLRQFAEAKLAVDPQQYTATMDRHCQYFARLLWDSRTGIVDKRIHKIVTALKVDIENIRQAWEWLINQGNWTAFDLAWETVTQLFHLTTRCQEGKTLFSLVLEKTKLPIENDQQRRARVIGLTQKAWYALQLSELTDGLKLEEEALAMFDDYPIDDPRLLMYTLQGHACYMSVIGNYQAALYDGHLLSEIASQTDLIYYRGFSPYILGVAYLSLGQLEEARESFQYLVELETPLELAYANLYLGQIDEILGDVSAAQTLLTQSVSSFRQLENPWGIGLSLINLGRVKGRSGMVREAAACLYEALDLAIDMQTPQQITGTVVEIAFLFRAIDRARLAVAMLELLQTRSVEWQEYHERIVPYLAELRLLVETDSLLAEKSQPLFTTMDQVIDTVQAARREFQASS